MAALPRENIDFVQIHFIGTITQWLALKARARDLIVVRSEVLLA